jgi:Lipocalin-like domain
MQGRESMNKSRNVLLASLGFAAALSAPATVLGQSLKDNIVGTWRTVSIYNEADGKKTHLYGERPVGLTMFDRSGNYMTYLSKPDVPKFANANRLKGTDAEYRGVMQSMISGFGTYTVDGDTVTIKHVASSYPNRAGTTEKRTYKMTSPDEILTSNPTAASGGTSYAKLVRVK